MGSHGWAEQEVAVGLKDALRSLRGHGEDRDAPMEEAADSDVPEPMTFRPRYDGIYHGTVQDSGEPGGHLRFSGNKVRYAPPDTAATAVVAAVAADAADPWIGDYTPAGRFTVQRRFERPVIHTVLQTDGDSFLARCTSGAGDGTAVLVYALDPDGIPQAGPPSGP